LPAGRMIATESAIQNRTSIATSGRFKWGLLEDAEIELSPSVVRLAFDLWRSISRRANRGMNFTIESGRCFALILQMDVARSHEISPLTVPVLR
jgi:hypothetical protein